MKYRARSAIFLALTISLFSLQSRDVESKTVKETRVIVESDGWKLVGDLVIPKSNRPVPAVILLNKAAGDRTVYKALAASLAERGIASLRVDLRGHGESINKGKFIPFNPQSLALTEAAHEDVSAVLRYLKTVRGIDAQRIGFVGASYSGEEMAVSARKYGAGRAYVAFSPGSFSEESMVAIDRSHVPWLFIKSAQEKAKSLQDFLTVLRQKSRTAQLMEVSGGEHATDILTAHPELAEIIAIWFKYNLR